MSRPVLARRFLPRRSDTGGDGVLKAQGIADGDRQLTDFQALERANCTCGAPLPRPDHREVGVRIVPEHVGRVARHPAC